MRIDRLKIINYRQYKELCVDFTQKNSRDLHLLIGKNGAGKTNFLNAINWCLYNDEPYLGSKNSSMPIANIYAENEKDIETKVELWVKINEDETVIFTRRAQFAYNKVANKLNTNPFKTEFYAERCFSDGKSVPINHDLDIFVDRIFPKGIREYFFFDGEQLDTYFKESQQSKISNMVYNISQLNLIDDAIKQMEKISKEIVRTIGKENPDIESISDEIEKTEKSLKEQGIDLYTHSENYKKANEKIAEISQVLFSMPDVTSLEQQRKSNHEKISKYSNEIKKLKKTKAESLIKYLKYVPFLSFFPELRATIEEKRVAKELPPTIDDELIDRILKLGLCTVCNRHLDEKAQQDLKNMRDQAILKSKIGAMLLEAEKYIDYFDHDSKHLCSDLQSSDKNIKVYEQYLDQLNQDQKEIERKLTEFDSVSIKQLQEQRKFYENQRNIAVAEKSRIGNRISQQEGILRNLESRLSQELKKANMVKQLTSDRKHAEILLSSLRELKEKLSFEIKDQVEKTTNKVFKDLIWKKESFEKVTVSDHYSVGLIHSQGYECLSNASAGERELLALSFTLALHKISGFDSPIVIDTPLARISDEHRESFSKIFNQVSKEKQVLLLLTPSEFSDDVKGIFHETASSLSYLQMTSDETETQLKEVG